MKNEFTISYWIRRNKVLNWNSIDSVIIFGEKLLVDIPICLNTTKSGIKYIIELLCTQFGYQKFELDIAEYLNEDLFVVITCKKCIVKIYFNSKLILEQNCKGE